MMRPFAPLWLALLAALLGGPPIGRSSVVACSDVASLRHVPADGAPESGYVRADAKWQMALDARSRRSPTPLARDGMLHAASPSLQLVRTLSHSVRQERRNTPPRRVCRSPLFPTGPPSIG